MINVRAIQPEELDKQLKLMVDHHPIDFPDFHARLRQEALAGRLKAIEDWEEGWLVWKAFIHWQSNLDGHYFCFVDGGLAVFTELPGHQIQLETSIKLSADSVREAGYGVRMALARSGPRLDGMHRGHRWELVPRRTNGFEIEPHARGPEIPKPPESSLRPLRFSEPVRKPRFMDRIVHPSPRWMVGLFLLIAAAMVAAKFL